MRYLKHFERLDYSSYRNVARELRRISPKKNKERADDLLDHAERMELNKVRHELKHKELSGLISPIWIRITDTVGTAAIPEATGVGRFYAVPYPEYEILEEYIEDDSLSVRKIPFNLVITPVDEEAEKVCREVMPEGPDLSLSGIGAMWLTIELKLEPGTYELGRMKLIDMDQYVFGSCELQGRAAYGTVKNTLQKMFTDTSGEFYQEFEERIIAGQGLSSEHGLSMKKIAEHLKSLSVNTGFMAD